MSANRDKRRQYNEISSIIRQSSIKAVRSRGNNKIGNHPYKFSTGIACKHGIKYPKHVSVCFESQKYPDSPTKIAQGVKDWTDATLKPGEKYYSHLAYKFSVKK